MNWNLIAIVVALIFGSLRITGIKDDFYKDIAHVYVGMMLGIAIYSRLKLYWILFIGLCLLETTCFILFKYGVL